MQGSCYHLVDWEEVFENSYSRKRPGPLFWVGVPTSIDGKAQAYIRRHEESEAIFGVWIGLVLLTGANPSHLRGYLTDGRAPFTIEDIAIQLGFREKKVAMALEFLCSAKVGLLEQVPWPLMNLPGERPMAAPPDPSDSRPDPSGSPPAALADNGAALVDETIGVDDSPDALGEVTNALAPPPDRRPPHTHLSYNTRKDPKESKIPNQNRSDPIRKKPNRKNRPGPPTGRTASNRTGISQNHNLTDQTAPEQTKPGCAVGAGRGGAGPEPPGPGRRPREQPPIESPPGSSVPADQRFRQRLVLELGKAFRLGPDRLNGQYKSFMAVAARVQNLPARDNVGKQLIELAEEKLHAGLRNPIAAWQSDVNKEYPPTRTVRPAPPVKER